MSEDPIYRGPGGEGMGRRGEGVWCTYVGCQMLNGGAEGGGGWGCEHIKAASRISGVGYMDTQYTKVCSLGGVFFCGAGGGVEGYRTGPVLLLGRGLWRRRWTRTNKLTV